MIREIEEDDLPQLMEIWNENYESLTSSKTEHTIDSLHRWFGSRIDGGFEYYGYFEQNELLGFAIVKNQATDILLKFIAVERSERGRCIGSELVSHVIRSNEDRNIKTEVLKENKSVVEFFEKQEFQFVKEEEDQIVLKYISQTRR